MTGRNAILDALLALVNAGNKYVTVSRKVRLWTNVPREERPACFILCSKESRTQPGIGEPPLITLHCELFIYVNATGQDLPANSAELESRLDDLDACLKPVSPYFNSQTLGGLVASCWIEGDTVKIPGDTEGDVGIAVVPIHILVPA